MHDERPRSRVPDTVTGRLFQATDWSRTAIGPAERWCAGLRTAVDICLHSSYPMSVRWGDEFINIYNDGYLPFLGDKHPGAFGQPAEVALREIWSVTGPRMQQVLSSGREMRQEDMRLLIARAQGRTEETYFNFSYTPLFDDHGDARGVLTIAHETTEAVLAKRREIALGVLAEKASRSRTIDELGRQAAAVLEASCDVDACETFLQSDAGHLRRLGPETLIPQEAVLDWVRSAKMVRSGAGPDSFQDGFMISVDVDLPEQDACRLLLFVRPARTVNAAGDYRAFLASIAAVLDRAAHRMVSEADRIRKVQRRLDGQERLYRLIFERSQDAIMFTVRDGPILAANPAACALLGYTEDEIRALGRGALVVDDGRLDEILEQRRRTGFYSGELTWRRKDGSEFVSDISSASFSEEDGEPRAVLVFRDASARRREEEQRESLARLDAIGQLAGGIAHDFNNLMSVILSAGDLLHARLEDGTKERASAELVHLAASRAAALTQQLLAYSRRQPLLPREIRIGDVLDEIDQILMRALGDNVRVIFDIERPDAILLADTAQLQTALLNLALNARDAMPGGGRLWIASREATLALDEVRGLEIEPGRYLRISVTDEGAGMPPEILARAVEPFYTTKKIGEGTGLGLSVVDGFARQSGGAMHIASREGKGTTVNLFFPLREGPDGGREEASSGRPGEAGLARADRAG